MNVTKKFATGYLSYKTGTEGPRHDPYGYEEYSVVKAGNEVVLHRGLGTWLLTNRNKLKEGQDGVTDKHCVDLFEMVAGISLKTFERVIHREKKCCNKPRIASIKGYPGETLYVCSNCDKVVGGSFNEAAVI